MSPHPSEVKGVQLLHSALARAVQDDEFRKKLLGDPGSVLRGEGLQIPDGVEVVIHENTAQQLHLVIPSRPQKWEELDVEEVNAGHLLECPF